VQTSNNLVKVELAEGKYQVQCLGRSSVDSEKRDLQTAIASALELCGATVVSSGSYPGWAPQPGSDLVKFMSALYLEKFKQEAHVSAVHAGLECGILGTNYPDMQMISFGPNIFGAHSPDERAQISSVQKFWDYLLAILQTIK
jgi:dipeptidase D